MAAPPELNARQRKHVHMHSTIFSEEGPTTKSVYTPSRQQELYHGLKSKLKEHNHAPPDLSLPSAGDIKCTQMAGHHGVVLPSSGVRRSPRDDDPEARVTPRSTRVTGPEVLVYDGEAKPVVHTSGKDREAIPKEFWATSVNLQWHDPRHEQCRQRNNGPQGLGAQEMKRHQLSSEIFGASRNVEISTTNPRLDLQADSTDYLRLDSHLHGSPQNKQSSEAVDARTRFTQNLNKSTLNTMPSHPGAQGPLASAEEMAHEDPANVGRRRQERNFSDLFGTKMGERREVRGNREEILASTKCSFLDSRTEIATRNKGHWKHDETESAATRKKAEVGSSLFDFNCPERPAMEPESQHALHLEGACWEVKDSMELGAEVARRRRQKDHLKDFQDSEGHNHMSRKQVNMSSAQVRLNMGAGPAPNFAGMRLSPRASAPPRASPEAERAALSAKDTKMASLQSNIFG